MAATPQESGAATLEPQEHGNRQGSTRGRSREDVFQVIDLEIASAEAPRHDSELVDTLDEVNAAVAALSERVAKRIERSARARRARAARKSPPESLTATPDQ